MGWGGTSVTSGFIGSGFVANGSIVSGSIASGQIGQMHISSGSINSGQVGNNAIVSGSIASGSAIDYGRNLFCDAFVTGETISGFRAASLTSGGVLVNAMAGSGLRLPAIGIVPFNYLSGAAAIMVSMGRVITTSGLDATWSGKVGTSLYVGSGGTLITSSGFVSGQFTQKVGCALSGGIYIDIDDILSSGSPTISIL